MPNNKDFNAAMDARGSTGPFGKFDDEIKIHIDTHTKTMLERAAADAGMPAGEFGREIFYLVFHEKLTHELSAERIRERMLLQGANGGLLRRIGGRS